MPSVLAILHPGFEEIEAIAPIDLLRRASLEVTTASLTGDRHVTGRNGITLHADTTLDAVIGQTFDCLLLPGGPGVKGLRADPRLPALVRDYASPGKFLAAICAAPLVLHDAGLLSGRRFTAHGSTADELPALLPALPVVRDGAILTSRGAGTALQFGLALIEMLRDRPARDAVAASIHWME